MLDKELEDPPFSIIAESDDSDSLIVPSDIEHFLAESDKSVLEEKIPIRSLHRSSRLRQHDLRIREARSRA